MEILYDKFYMRRDGLTGKVWKGMKTRRILIFIICCILLGLSMLFVYPVHAESLDTLSDEAESAEENLTMLVEVINEPENHTYYMFYEAHEVQDLEESETAYIKIIRENTGNTAVKSGRLTVSVEDQSADDRLIFAREEKFRLEPGKRTVLGNSSISPVAVRFARQDAEEENVTVVVRYEAYLDDPDITGPMIVEKELQLPVGYGRKSGEASASEEDVKTANNNHIWLSVTGVFIVLAVAIAAILLKKKNKMEKNVRVAAVTERLSAVPTHISKAGSGGPGSAVLENITVTFVREDNTSLSLLCSAEEIKMLEEGMIGDITYSGNELISFMRSADNPQNL